ncbi:hypothetical protein [Xanthomonas sp. LMC-A-07]|uniref:hypothetical protein n=1 Tax=Xanthomonas sp. LMC-A-07 TaxID=3040329 RepID=UPI002555B6AA|nr:hypothetical protein [Xanthomonas sp. LMC-A-07]
MRNVSTEARSTKHEATRKHENTKTRKHENTTARQHDSTTTSPIQARHIAQASPRNVTAFFALFFSALANRVKPGRETDVDVQTFWRLISLAHPRFQRASRQHTNR